MRNDAPLLWIALLAALACSAQASERLVGKRPTWETPSVVQASDGEAVETPNQRRRRMGLPIEASFPPPTYGEARETPNQMRKRLGLAADASIPEPYAENSTEIDEDESDERLAKNQY